MARILNLVFLAVISIGMCLIWLEVTPPIARTEQRGGFFIWLPAVYFFHGLLYLIPAVRSLIPLYVPVTFAVLATIVAHPPLPWIAFILFQLYFVSASYGHKLQQKTI